MLRKLYRNLRYDWPLHFVLFLTNWMPDNVKIIQMRGTLASFFFFSAGRNIQIGRDVTFYDPSKISIGNDVYFAKGVWICGGERIVISDKVLFGPYAVIVTSDHSLSTNGSYFDGPNKNKGDVNVDSGCWIAAHAVILGNSHLKQGTLIAANSVFKGTSEPFGIYGGIPAKFIKNAKKA